MRIITHETYVRRNVRIARALSPIGLVILLAGLVVSFTRPEQVILSFSALILGFLFTSVGTYFGNRWIRRPDLALDAALKGMDDRHSLYHYRLGASHALICPAGVFALVPRFQRGQISYDPQKGKWRHKGGNLYLQMFGQEGLGNPSTEGAVEADALARKLKKLLPDVELPPVQAVIVFTNDAAQVDAGAAPYTALHARKLKEHVRSLPKGKTFSRAALKALDERLGVN